MPAQELPITELIKQYETYTGWGDSANWKNQDFINLSEKIREKTGASISHVTLKRIWGKVKYDSLPNTYTMDTLVQFLGYENFRVFSIQFVPVDKQTEQYQLKPKPVKKHSRSMPYALGVLTLVGILLVVIMASRSELPKPPIVAKDYKFSSKKVITSGLPNSVVFDFDATRSPYDSVAIQQSWDRHLRVNVSKNDRQHTSIYYFPDFYYAKLIVGGKIVKQHELFVESNGWLPIVEKQPVPIYYKKKDAMVDGKLSLLPEKIKERNIAMQPTPPYVVYTNVTNFGEIYSNDFTFETSVKNNYSEGAAACRLSTVYILCKGTAIWIPLSSKGCVSDLDMYFAGYEVSGKKHDLSAFGVDFEKYVPLKIESHQGKAQIYIDNKLVYTIDKGIGRAKIIGIVFRFQGTGSVDYVRLKNGKVNYDDEF
ncbi:hypothetical protein SAMN05192574_101170 [Mucilaginibacter gossypiicola]|uniref:Uncharacterized protein n=1 Tax=Mucilaginibacter gossypiicola TaxID=551995 RepID=A0A1H7ZUI0_9SPHI|nr:hypothetical protein [Mucilaginibacter gossypiicola]SEM61208.1 hypothetical protein SAMN05192574_101170 [Mucilaginibacter gossypiicola]